MKLTRRQQEFLDAALRGESIFLTGKAGTGKSFVVKEFIKRCKKNVAKLGTTGVAATNIGGQTIHSFFGINPYEVYNGRNAKILTGKKRHIIDSVDVIIIDEVSMLRVDVLDAINGTMILNGCGYLSGKQVIFVGDMKQLPVVQKGREKEIIKSTYKSPFFYHANCYRYLNIKNIELTEVKRQSDARFIEALNKIRDGGKDSYFRNFVSDKPNNGVILAPHNQTVSEYNQRELSKIEGDLLQMTAVIEGDLNPKNYPVDTKIQVKHGARIMYCVNDKSKNLVNGDIGHLIIRDDKFYFYKDGHEVRIEEHVFENQKYVVERVEKETENGDIVYVDELKLKTVGTMVQYPIKLAYAITIHKSQGMTFDEVTVDISRRCFAPGQLYVALSRCSNPKGLKIII